MKETKIVYQDNGNSKVVFGQIESEDDCFVSIVTTDGTRFRIGKRAITTIKGEVQCSK